MNKNEQKNVASESAIPDDLLKPGTASPLADPVFEAIFQDAASSKLALQSLVNAVLINSGEDPIYEIISIVAQKSYSMVNERGCRLDLEAKTKDNSWVNIEVQLYTEPYMAERNIFHLSRILSSQSQSGDDIKEMAQRMPRVIIISLVNFDMRKDHPDFDQSAHIRYDKAPHAKFSDKIGFYCLELPKFMAMEKDWKNPLHCWLHALYTAHTEVKSLKEVVNMHEALKEYYETDTGFAQFVKRHNLVATDPETLANYYRWLNAFWAEFNVLRGAQEEGFAKGLEEGRTKGLEEGREEGREEGIKNTALSMLKDGMPEEKIAQYTGLSTEEIKRLEL